jgi:hypothetical protein
MSGAYSQSNSESDTTSNSKSNSNPWEEAIPGLKDMLSKIEGLQGNAGVTDKQGAAIAQMEANAAEGNPWAANIGDVANKAFGLTSQSGVAGDAYNKMKEQLDPYASGEYLDFAKNPYIQKMLETSANDAAKRVNAMYAGAGRDLSGANQAAVGTAVTNAQAPILFDAYKNATAQQIAASQALGAAGDTAAKTMQGLDTSAIDANSKGAALANLALEAKNWGPKEIANLEQMLKNIPINEQKDILSLLGPIAGLGGSTASSGSSHTEGSTSGFSAGASIM